jgi:hypothetical protein
MKKLLMIFSLALSVACFGQDNETVQFYTSKGDVVVNTSCLAGHTQAIFLKQNPALFLSEIERMRELNYTDENTSRKNKIAAVSQDNSVEGWLKKSMGDFFQLAKFAGASLLVLLALMVFFYGVQHVPATNAGGNQKAGAVSCRSAEAGNHRF